MESSATTRSQSKETITENSTPKPSHVKSQSPHAKRHIVSLFHRVAQRKGAPPFDMEWLARALGLTVEYSKRVDNKISGWIERQKGNKFHIVINDNHSETRKRFTLAHEMAHFVLHENHIIKKISDNKLYRSSLSNDLEREANAYAAEILMPYSILQHDVEKQLKERFINDDLNEDKLKEITDTLAKQYDVSRQAMAIRLGSEFGMWM